MSISRLSADGIPVRSQTVTLVSAPSVTQIFDLGGIATAYVRTTLLSQDNDGVPLDSSGAGAYTWQPISPGIGAPTPQPTRSRSGVFDDTSPQLDANPAGDLAWPFTPPSDPPLPALQQEATGLTGRYIKVVLALFSNTDGVIYAGPQNPTATWEVYVEYV